MNNAYQIENDKDVKVEVPFILTTSYLSDIIVTALEGGINYWCSDITIWKDGLSLRGLGQLPDDFIGLVNIEIEEDETGDRYSLNTVGVCSNYHSLVRSAILKMKALCPQHLFDLVNEDYDATTADVFIQLMFFGEVRYG